MKKLLAFTDPHGDVQDAEIILKLAEIDRPDLIVCSGDFSLFGNNWKSFLDVLSRIDRKIYFVGGNHEAEGLMVSISSLYPFVVDVSYRTAEESGILIGGVPGYDTDFWPSKKIDQDAVGLAREIWKDRDLSKPFVFLTHYAPAGAVDGLSSPTPDAGGSATVASIIRAIKPALVVTGHYHQDFGGSGLIGDVPVVNPGPSGKLLRL